MAASCRSDTRTRRRALAAVGLDVTYASAQGDRLYFDDGQCAWDFLGGYGATLFGHNHPALVAALVDFLDRRGVVHAQASVRSASDALADKLRERLRALGTYEFVFGNTGAEAVEIAAKHADFVFATRRDKAATWVDGATPPRAAAVLTADARETLTRMGVRVQSDVCEAIAAHNRRVLASPPVFLATHGGFHGKTARALELTDNALGRFGPSVSLSRVLHIDARPGSLAEALVPLTSPLLRLQPQGEKLTVECLEWTRVSGVFVEPLQGEGGIRPADADVMQDWQACCASKGVPLIADEIQCGLGRTGTFLYSEQLGIRPDYVLLGKSLGGGLAKISAVAIRREQYLDEFSMLHSSTYAEDDLSACVALRALELLDEESALDTAAEKGDLLRAALVAVAERHPTVIREVRGRGLMVGVEWHVMDFDRSNALRFLQDHDLLGYALSGYLLRAHGVRVAPALSSHQTLRIEASYLISDEAIASLVDGLEDLCVRLERQDVARILGTCLGVRLRSDATVPRGPRVICRTPASESHVGFIGHFIDSDGVGLWDPALACIGPGARQTFLERIRPFAEPQVCHRDHVDSRTGERAMLSFIGIPVSSAQCDAALRGPGREELRDLVQRAVNLAVREGCTVVGLGGYTSILTRNGKALKSNGTALTTGNGFTVGAALLALEATAKELGVRWTRARAAVIGATGNIGSVIATLLAREVAALTLIGRPTRAAELELLAGRILGGVLAEAPESPIARAIAERGHASPAAQVVPPAVLYCRILRALGDASPIRIAFDASACCEAQLVVASSNSPSAVVFAEHVSGEPSVILDLSVPDDVDDSVARLRPSARVIRAGVIRTPHNPNWYVPGIPLGHGEMFACMAETVLMGFEGARTHGSYGALTVERVRHTLELATKHGFTEVRLNGAKPS